MGKPNEWPMPAPRTQSQGEAFPVSHSGLMCTVGFLVAMCTVGFLGSPAESTGGSYSAPPDSPFPREMSVAHLHIQASTRRPSSYPAEGIEYSDSDTGHFSVWY